MPGSLTANQWREDLRYLADALEREHQDPYHTLSPRAFRSAVPALDGRIPFLAGHEVVVALARLLAGVGDGHTALRLTGVRGFHRFPLDIYMYSDGLFVRSVAREWAEIAGARLLSIGGIPACEAYEAVRAVVSRDNELVVRAQAPELLSVPEVLHACGVIPTPHGAAYELGLHDGARVVLQLEPVQELPPDMVDARGQAQRPTPHWLQRPGENWYEYLPGSGTLYVAYNRVRDSDTERLAYFFDRVFEFVTSQAVQRLVLDIRSNGGGNMALSQPLVHHLIRCDRVNRWGGLYAIIGRGVFSAAMNLAVDLERHTRVLFVGEPTGGSPNHHGENVEIILPNSGLRATVASLWWQASHPLDDRPWIAPDIPARLGSADYASNRDPALEAILSHEPLPGGYEEYPNRLLRQLRRDDLLLPPGSV